MAKMTKEQVFSLLIDEKLPMLRNVVYRIMEDEHDTDDVIQSALLKAWNKFDSYDDRAQLSSWVCRIACNLAYDQFRQRRRETIKLENFKLHGENKHSDTASERLEQVKTALGRLPAKLHVAMNLTAFEEMSPEEAAKLQGCSVSTLYWRIHKARKLLRKQLASEADYE